MPRPVSILDVTPIFISHKTAPSCALLHITARRLFLVTGWFCFNKRAVNATVSTRGEPRTVSTQGSSLSTQTVSQLCRWESGVGNQGPALPQLRRTFGHARLSLRCAGRLTGQDRGTNPFPISSLNSGGQNPPKQVQKSQPINLFTGISSYYQREAIASIGTWGKHGLLWTSLKGLSELSHSTHQGTLQELYKSVQSFFLVANSPVCSATR